MDSIGTLTASLEDYLEAIFNVISEQQAVRPKDIAQRLGVSNPSVTGALRALAEKKLINYAPYELITLTALGENTAKDVVRRHEVLKDFFLRVLAVEESEAEKAACQMEHSVSKEITERLVRFAEFIDVCPRGGTKWISGFSHNCDLGSSKESCDKCINSILDNLHKPEKEGNKMESTKLRLSDLDKGQKAKVSKVRIKGNTGKRIVEMGLTKGSVVEIERFAPLGDPIDIKVKGYHLSLRKDEAELVDVELL